MSQLAGINRNLALEAVRATEAAAIAASSLMGRGDEEEADRTAGEALRDALNAMSLDGRVVIGEGDQEQSPILYTGEKVGLGEGPQIDFALEPLECITSAAKGGPNALSIVAMAERGNLFQAPPVYMNKIAVGGGLPEGIIDLDATPEENLRAIAEAKGCEVSDLVVCVLERPRHDGIINAIRETGARIKLIPDGDVSAVIATSQPSSGIDVYIGIGGALEGVLGAVALKCIGGQFQGRLVFRKPEERKIAAQMGVKDLEKKYSLDDLVQGQVMFAATGVTDGALLQGVQRIGSSAQTHSLVMNSRSGTIRFVEAYHDLTRSGLLEE
ncbi:Fructose-1,6-bisphosphatase class 2 [Candidatus Terasakiella magnetica]|uniref:Fructose-1,6-bisphosphatase n=1 Tax=Candidatus Terasakiella magnetica TaxID=1867952 RepID=A0A1C3RBZ9_9PROT|nr:class II fructose-bisphosphatase [Candidatus Terasakiella magnetica]SCA54791.1 Fructose-1,6-bisphosphatase class 2 [Candidatus Terasakiella magnetica]